MMTTRDLLLGDVYVLEHRIMHFYGNTKMNLQRICDMWYKSELSKNFEFTSFTRT